MDPDTPGTNYDASAPAPAKRKRGRPLYGSQLHPVGSVPTSNDITIGQVVSGFIEASFDGGYLLALRAGNSETTMRGVVFKHGRYVPVSAENDVAPDVKMIKRCEIPQQSENLSNLQHSRGKIEAAHHPPSFSPSLVSTGGKPLLPVSTQVTCPTPSRGNMVPALLQQVTSANGSLVTTHSHPVQIHDVGLSSVGPQTPPVPILGSHSLNGSTVTKPSGDPDLASAGGAQNQSVGQGSQSRAPFENLMTEVNRRIQHPAQADGNQNESSSLIGKSTLDEVSDADDQPLYVEPLQTRQPVLTCNPNLIPPQLDNDRSAKMTQLLQAVQENAVGNVLSQNQIPPPPSNPM